MSKRDQYRSKAERRALKASGIAAGTVGLLIAFLLTPIIYSGTAPWMAEYANTNYVDGAGSLVLVIWFPIIMLLTTTLSMLGLTNAARFATVTLIDLLNHR